MSGLMSIVLNWYSDGFRKSTAEMADLAASIYITPLSQQFHYDI